MVLYKIRFSHSKLTQRFLNHLSYSPNFLLHALPYCIFIGGSIIAKLILGQGGEGHVAYFLEGIGIKSLIRNTIYYVGIFGDFFALPDKIKPMLEHLRYSFLIPNFLGFVLFLLTLPYIFRGCLKHNNPFITLFVCGSLALLIIWPATQGIRFVFCILPFLVLWAMIGLEMKKARFFYPIIVVLFVMFGVKDIKYIFTNLSNHISAESRNYEAFDKEALEIYDFIKTHTKTNDIIIFFKPRVLYLNTARLSFTTQNSQNLSKADYFLYSIDDYGVFSSDEIADLIANKRLIPIKQNTKFTLYKINK